MSPLTRSAALPSATAIAAGLLLLPWAQALPFDFERNAVLLLFTPALVLGRGLWAETWATLPALWQRLIQLSGLALLLSVATAAHAAAAAVHAAHYPLLLLITLTGAGAVRHEPVRGTRVLLAALLLSPSLGVLTMLLKGLSVPDPRNFDWVWGLPLYVQVRHFGFHLLGACIAVLCLAAYAPPRSAPRFAFLGLGTLLWAALFWSGGRAPVLGLALAGLSLWPLAAPSCRREVLFCGGSLLLMGMGLSLLCWVSDPNLGWWSALSRTHVALDDGNLVTGRTEIWRECLSRLRDHPWLGLGPDSYRFITPKMSGQQPHNILVQLLLDVGILGTLPMVGLGASVLWRGMAHRPIPVAGLVGGLILIGTLVLGCLDGPLYHSIGLVPAAVAASLLVGSVAPHPAPAGRTFWLALIGGIAALVLLGHAWLFHQLNYAPPPPSPAAAAPRLLRAFPSTTFGLTGWLRSWGPADPDLALAWCRWAQQHAPDAWRYHREEAVIHHALNRPAESLRAMELAIANAPAESRRPLRRELALIRRGPAGRGPP